MPSTTPFFNQNAFPLVKLPFVSVLVRRVCKIFVQAVALVAFVAAFVVTSRSLGQFVHAANRSLRQPENSGPGLRGILPSKADLPTAIGGTPFAMARIRTYTGQRMEPGHIPESFGTLQELKCNRWAVLTPNEIPTEGIRQLASPINDWCVIVVGDKQGWQW